MHHLKIIAVIVSMLLTACSERGQKDTQPSITVSILPQKYLTERITGNNFTVNVLVPPGASPETYEPTPKQMQDIAESRIYFRIGYIDFERTIIRNLQDQNNDLKFVNTSEGMDLITAGITEHGDHVHLQGVDPHTWLSVPGVKIQLENMLTAIVDIDPENKDYYWNNYNEFNNELDSLHKELTGKFSNIKRKTFLIFHPALAYFARDYGLSQISIEHEGKNPTASNMKQIVDIAREENIRDIFIQMEFERDNARAVARELGGEVIEIDPLSADWMENFKDIADKLYQVLNR